MGQEWRGLLIGTVVLLCGPEQALAATITYVTSADSQCFEGGYCQDIPLTSVPQTTETILQRFDPSLGTLVRVRLRFDFQSAFRFTGVAQESGTHGFYYSLQGTVDSADLGTVFDQQIYRAYITNSLEPLVAGQTYSGGSGEYSGFTQEFSGASLDDWIGTTPLIFMASLTNPQYGPLSSANLGNGTVLTLPTSFEFQETSITGARLFGQVEYEFNRVGGEVPLPAAAWLLLSGLGGLGLLARRRAA